jgi:hypothetical protein
VFKPHPVAPASYSRALEKEAGVRPQGQLKRASTELTLLPATASTAVIPPAQRRPAPCAEQSTASEARHIASREAHGPNVPGARTSSSSADPKKANVSDSASRLGEQQRHGSRQGDHRPDPTSQGHRLVRGDLHLLPQRRHPGQHRQPGLRDRCVGTGRSGRVSIYAATNGARFLNAPVFPDETFRNDLDQLPYALDLDEVHLTGGEPILDTNRTTAKIGSPATSPTTSPPGPTCPPSSRSKAPPKRPSPNSASTRTGPIRQHRPHLQVRARPGHSRPTQPDVNQ